KSGDLHPDAGRRQAGGGAWLPVAVAASRAARCLFVDARHAHRLSNAVAVANLAAERHLRACAASFGHLAGKEAAAMDVEALLLLREDEAEVLLLVEPEHLTLHEACLPSVRSVTSSLRQPQITARPSRLPGASPHGRRTACASRREDDRRRPTRRAS